MKPKHPVGPPMLRRIQNAAVVLLFGCGVFGFGFAVVVATRTNHWEWGHADPGVTLVTLFLVVVGVVQAGLFIWNLRIIKQTLGPAEDAARAAIESADAARLNAQALIDAESAQVYVVLLHSDIEKMFQLGTMYDTSPSMHASAFGPPWVEYRLKNYGKSPAIVQQVLDGMSLENPKIKQTREWRAGQEAMEIIGVGDQGRIIKCAFEKSLTFGDVRSIVTNDRLLFFYGHAVFIDHFGRKQTLEWEFLADRGNWNLIAHRNTRETPDGKRSERGAPT
jgi:hypothetical protein